MKARAEQALGYVRVSTQRQADGGISLDNQETRLSEHYRRLGVELVDIYRDGGLSGTTDNRPGLQALFEHAMRVGSGITEIGVYSFSRLFRDHYRTRTCDPRITKAYLGFRKDSLLQWLEESKGSAAHDDPSASQSGQWSRIDCFLVKAPWRGKI